MNLNDQICLNLTKKKLSNYNFKMEGESRLIYVDKLKCLLSVNSKNNEIYCCDVNNTKQSQYEWKILSIPKTICDDNHVILAFDSILFIFCYLSPSKHIIYCLDLINNKYTKCDLYYQFKKCMIFKGDHDMVHFLNTINNGKHSRFHYKTKLNNLLPSETVQIYRKRYNDVVNGYCKDEKFNHDITTKNNIIQYILKYYAYF